MFINLVVCTYNPNLAFGSLNPDFDKSTLNNFTQKLLFDCKASLWGNIFELGFVVQNKTLTATFVQIGQAEVETGQR